MRILFLSQLVLFLVTAPCFCATPEQIVGQYFEQIKAGGMRSISSLMHPDEQKKFRGMLEPIVEHGLKSKQGPAFRNFADPTDPTQIRALSDEEFMSEFMGFVESQAPQLTDILKHSRIQILGHVAENDMNHVVVRLKMKYGEAAIDKMAVMTVKNYQGQPRMMLTGEMTGIAEVLKARQ